MRNDAVNLAISKPSRRSAPLPISEPNSLCIVCRVLGNWVSSVPDDGNEISARPSAC